MMGFALSVEARRAAEVARAESLMNSTWNALQCTQDTEKKLTLMWELAFVHLQGLETFRRVP